MVFIATILFAIAALAGLYLAFNHFTKKTPPIGIALLHGALAATGLVLLLVHLMTQEGPSLLYYAVGLFAVAALGGFLLFSFRLRKISPPPAFIVVHALLAVSGFVCLVLAQL